MTFYERYANSEGSCDAPNYYPKLVSNYATENLRRNGNNSTEHEFPLRWTVTVLAFCVSCTLFIIPLLAIAIPPAPRTGLDWWTSSTIYFDTISTSHDKHDGLSDRIEDVLGRLDALVESGFNAICITMPYTTSSQMSIENTALEAEPNLKLLIKTAHKKGVKVVIDLLPNHSTLQHAWFLESQQDQHNQFSDYYVWHSGTQVNGTVQPPNNWASISGGSAWTWMASRSQFYLHQLARQYPDLNYRNDKLSQHITDLLQWWLDQDVDGLYMSGVDLLYENSDLSVDEPRSCDHQADKDDHAYLSHVHTTAQPDVHTLIKQWRTLVDTHAKHTKKPILLLVGVSDQSDLPGWANYYNTGAHLPNTDIIERAAERVDCDAVCIQNMYLSRMSLLPEGSILTSHMSIGDGLAGYAEVVALLTLFIPGPSFIQPQHLHNLPPGWLAQVSSLKRQPALYWGWIQHALADHNILSFIRLAKGWSYKKFLIAVNLGNVKTIKNFCEGTASQFDIKRVGKVVFHTSNFQAGSEYVKGNTIDMRSIELLPAQGLVIEF